MVDNSVAGDEEGGDAMDGDGCNPDDDDDATLIL